jgi:hypothetical protein
LQRGPWNKKRNAIKSRPSSTSRSMPALRKECDGAAEDTPLGAPHMGVQQVEPPQRQPYCHWVRQDGRSSRRRGARREQTRGLSPSHPAHAASTLTASTNRVVETRGTLNCTGASRRKGGAGPQTSIPPRRHGRPGKEATPHTSLLTFLTRQRRREKPRFGVAPPGGSRSTVAGERRWGRGDRTRVNCYPLVLQFFFAQV